MYSIYRNYLNPPKGFKHRTTRTNHPKLPAMGISIKHHQGRTIDADDEVNCGFSHGAGEATVLLFTGD